MDISKMTIEQRIEAFWERHSVIDTTLVPDVWLTWTGKRDKKEYRKYYQLSTGIVTEDKIPWLNYIANGQPAYYNNWFHNPDDNLQGIGHGRIKDTNKLMLNAGNECQYYYFKYDDELEIIEISVIYVDTHRYNTKLSQEENVRLWKRNPNYSMFFMERGSKTKYDIHGNVMLSFDYEWKWYNEPRVTQTADFSDWLKNMRRMNVLKTCAKEFERFGAGSLYGACGRALNPFYTYDIEDWFLRDNGYKNKGAIGKKIDELCDKITLNLDHLKNIYKEEPAPANFCYYSANDIVYIDLTADNNWAVLRYMFRRNDGSLDESYRVFVHNNGKVILARKTGPNTWTTATNISNGWRGSKGKIVNIHEMRNHRRLSYIADMVESFPETARLGKIITILRNPVSEQLWKAELPNIVTKLLANNKFNENVQSMFGEVNLKEKNLFAKFGMNKRQMETLDDFLVSENSTHSSYRTSSACMIKQLFGVNDISHIDIETFENLLGMVEMMRKACYFRDIQSGFGLPAELGLNINQQIKLWLRLYRLGLKHQRDYDGIGGRSNNVFKLLHDTINLYNRFPASMKPDFDIQKIDSYSDVIRLHDGITALYNARQQEIADENNREKEEKMKKLDEKRKKVFEAEDDEFLIRLPVKLSEIIREGGSLNHCVGGYVDRHATGSTTILFLRKKSDKDKSFYTIECHGTDPKKGITVTQIHGQSNKWLGNNPEAVPFVLRWLRDKGIKCKDEIVLSTAKGYSSWNATMIPKPAI